MDLEHSFHILYKYYSNNKHFKDQSTNICNVNNKVCIYLWGQEVYHSTEAQFVISSHSVQLLAIWQYMSMGGGEE